MDAAAYADAIFDDAEQLVEIGWDSARELLDIETGFDTIPTWAIDELRKYAEDFGATLVARDKQTLFGVIENALIDGSSASDTAAAIKGAFAAGVTIYDGNGRVQSVQKTDAWFATVARTELQRAAVSGQVALYKSAGIETVRWDVAAPCDECAEADGVVLPIGDTFPGVDVDQPPAHPNCRCVLVPADKDLGDYRGGGNQDEDE